jgi:cellulose synthase/poly-beta-1,6-N-acetylglucosamine synthase-like glycosyltransferase
MWLSVVFGALLLSYVLLVLWYRWAWRQLPEVVTPHFEPTTSVTVLVPARNESRNIEACLQSLVAQEYPVHLLQIVVIDDASEDDTSEKVADMAARHPHVSCLRMEPDAAVQSHKKRAIEKGIASATGELIVCTDADCSMGPHWLSALVFAKEKNHLQFVAAPVRYQPGRSLLSVFQTLDFTTLQGITGASVSKRFHTMCNGANIAYTKAAFEEVGGFAGIDQLPTGDDMLLMHKIFRRYPQGVQWLKSKEAVVSTQPCSSWRDFFQQRIRWASKAAFYDDKRIFYVLLLVYLFNVMFPVMAVAGFFLPGAWWWLLIALIVKTLIELFFLAPVAAFFGDIPLLRWFPFLQVHHIIYTIIAGWLGRFGRYEWKGRVIQKPSALLGQH